MKATKATTAKKRHHFYLAGFVQDQPPSKKLQPGELLCMSSMASEGGDGTLSIPNLLPPPSLPPSLPLSPQPSLPIVMYWEPPKAKKLFNPKQGD